ncbi:hypothetical protein [Pantoea ananatis]|uniref:hypothetical protein n=1 Tax=Pantoea ananas TaxID=553 RepID=UPI001F4D5FE7|nr:hypothetical protein [Pantoea ananatis]MCH9269667.1 hypothetical protein [Pantoea ananatis]
MKISKRLTWLLVLLFCVVVWGMVAVAFAGEVRANTPKTQPGHSNSQVDTDKIRKLDLNTQQKKFIESLIESPPEKLSGN